MLKRLIERCYERNLAQKIFVTVSDLLIAISIPEIFIQDNLEEISPVWYYHLTSDINAGVRHVTL